MIDHYRLETISISTKHAKERIIARPLAVFFGLRSIVPAVDTDSLGTFSGEIPRIGSMEDTVIKKARLGMDATGAKLGIANEGSFGSHPNMPFIPSNLELITWIDDIHGFCLTEKLLSTSTNFGFCQTNQLIELERFLKQIGFPEHAVIMWPHGNRQMLAKGITDYKELKNKFKTFLALSPEKRVHIETDMRAHLNPLRRRNIRRLTFQLIRRLNVLCPHCRLPGWGIVQSLPGLPCKLCEQSTNLIGSKIYGCVKCNYKETLVLQQKAEPRFCEYCNP